MEVKSIGDRVKRLFKMLEATFLSERVIKEERTSETAQPISVISRKQTDRGRETVLKSLQQNFEHIV